MEVKSFDVYRVDACAETGLWLSEPEKIGRAPVADWHGRADTEREHYDTFERADVTCGIVVRFW